MRIWIDVDEYYPFMSASDEAPPWTSAHMGSIAITSEEWVDYQEVDRRFHEWQKKLEALANSQRYVAAFAARIAQESDDD